MKVRKDCHGLYIRSRSYSADRTSPAYRPGTFSSYSHVWNTGAVDISFGDMPKTNHVDQAPFVCIVLDNGNIVYWGSYGRSEGDFAEVSS